MARAIAAVRHRGIAKIVSFFRALATLSDVAAQQPEAASRRRHRFTQRDSASDSREHSAA
jgi:hypothetical protein